MKQLVKFFPAILVLVIGVLASIWTYSFYKDKVLNERELLITSVIEKDFRIIENELTRVFNSIEVLHLIASQKKIVTSVDFENYAIPILKANQNIKALSWVPKITDQDRLIFENELSKIKKLDINIKELNSESKFVISSKKQFYFPVTYIEPLNENIKALGFDIYSDSLRRQTIDLAVKSDEMIFTPKILLVQDSIKHGILGIKPVYKISEADKNIENVKGLISAVFKVEELINAAILKTNNQNLSLVVFDITNNKREVFTGNINLLNTQSDFIKKKILLLGGRSLELDFIINPNYYNISNIKSYKLGGILISFLLFLLLLVPIIKERKLQLLNSKLIKEKKIRNYAQQSLTESEEKYRFMFANNPQPMWIFDIETLAFLEVNNAAIIHYGYTREEFLSMTIKDIRPADDVNELLNTIKNPSVKYNHLPNEWRHVKKNGEIIYVEITFHQITFNNRLARHVMANDISDRKLAKKKLQESQEYLSIIYNNSEFAILVIEVLNNGEYRFEGCNPRNEELVGIKNEDLVGKTPDELTEYLGTETVNYLKMMYDQCVLTRKSITSEYFIPEGFNKGWWLSTFNPIIDENTDTVVKLIASGFLITDRKQAEENLISSKKQLEFVSNHIPVFIAQLNSKKQYTFVNKQYAQLFGLLPEDILGKHAKEVIGDKAFEFASPFMDLVLLGQSTQYELSLDNGSNQSKFLNVDYVPDINDKGEVIGFIASISDITEREKAENQVKEYAANLKSLIDNRKDSIWSLDLDFNYIVFNQFYADSFYEHFKFNVEKGMCALDTLTPEAYEFWVPKYKLAFAGESSDFRFNYDVEGKSHHFQVSLNPIYKDNNIVGVSSISIEITDRLLAEEEVRLSEERYRALFENIPSGFVLFEVVLNDKGAPIDHIILMANEKFEQTTGLKLQNVIGKRLTQVLPGIENDAADWIGRYAHVALTGVPGHFDQGSELLGFYYDVSAYQPAPNQCAVIFEDVTERKRVEKELMESEELLRLSTELADVAAWEMDLVADSMTRSSNHDNLYGLSNIGQWHVNTFMDATHIDDREKCNDYINKSVAPGGPDEYKFDFRILYPDKSIHWLNVIGKIIDRDSNGTATKIRGFLTDITDRKQAEEALKKSEEEFRALAESMPQIVWVCRADGWNIYFNQQWVDYTGLTLEESYGHGWNTPFHPDDQQRAWNAWQNAVNNNGVYSIEARLRRFDGVYKWWLVRGVPILNDKGEILKWYGTCTDIDRFKNVSEDFKNLNVKLEQLVKERTAQLENLNKELQTFTYSVSHDLKAPLRGIDGYSNLLQELYSENLNDEGKHFINAIQDGVSKMNDLIEDLLEYSRLERAQINYEKINIKKLLESIKSQFEKEIEFNNFNFIINVPDTEIISDKNGLTIVIRNLVDNAIKFSKNNEKPLVEITLIENSSNWLLVIKDNGIGFEMKYEKRIFEIFQRLNLPEEFPGTGIGLAMVYKAMEKLGGKVWAESQLGKGASFYLEIPKQKLL